MDCKTAFSMGIKYSNYIKAEDYEYNFICEDKDETKLIKKFYYYKDFQSFYNYILARLVKFQFSRTESYYDIYNSSINSKVKFFIDYDMKVDTDLPFDDYMSLLFKKVGELSTYVQTFLNNNNEKIITTVSIKEGKISIHIVAQQLFEMPKLKTLIQSTAIPGVDQAVYKSVQQLRTIFNSKKQKYSPLWPIEFVKDVYESNKKKTPVLDTLINKFDKFNLECARYTTNILSTKNGYFILYNLLVMNDIANINNIGLKKINTEPKCQQ